MDWHGVVGIAAGVIQVASIFPYARDMFKGTTRPNAVSWGLWSLLQIISVAAQLSAGASWSVLLIIAATFNTTLVFVLCIFGYGYKKYGFTDGLCLVFAIAAITLWYITSNPIVAILLAIAADMSASVPTIIKAYKDPYSETAISWFMVTITASMSIVSTTKFDIANLAWPLYFFVGCGLTTALIFFGQRAKKAPK